MSKFRELLAQLQSSIGSLSKGRPMGEIKTLANQLTSVSYYVKNKEGKFLIFIALVVT